MSSLVGRNVVITLAEPFTLGAHEAEVRGTITATTAASTGPMLVIDSEVGPVLISPRYSGQVLSDLGHGRLVVHVARLKGGKMLEGRIDDEDIENVGSGVARLEEDHA